ncbi:MAG: histidine phosphatase family protein [Patescibacteria group bacterium]
MTTWYLFRHALATHSQSGYGDNILTATILPEGIPPIERMAEYIRGLPKSVNWSSELLRCGQTTNIITKITGRTFTTDARLNEYYNETFEVFRKRIASWLDGMMTLHPSIVLVCTHGAVIAGLKHLIIEGEFLESQSFDYPKCGQLLVVTRKRSAVLDFVPEF